MIISKDFIVTNDDGPYNALRVPAHFSSPKTRRPTLRRSHWRDQAHVTIRHRWFANCRGALMRIVDLSLPIDGQMRGVAIRPARRLEEDGWNASTLQLYSHAGTHIDAPYHFLPDGNTLEEQDLSVVVGTALVINLAPVVPRQLLRVEDLSADADRIVPGTRLLLRTDWHRRDGTAQYRDELPRISLELAQWLVSREVALVGVEPPSVADVNNIEELTTVHQTLFRGNVVIVEGLAHLDQIASREVQFVALPLKVLGGDGSPVRAIAIESD